MVYTIVKNVISDDDYVREWLRVQCTSRVGGDQGPAGQPGPGASGEANGHVKTAESTGLASPTEAIWSIGGPGYRDVRPSVLIVTKGGPKQQGQCGGCACGASREHFH